MVVMFLSASIYNFVAVNLDRQVVLSRHWVDHTEPQTARYQVPPDVPGYAGEALGRQARHRALLVAG